MIHVICPNPALDRTLFLSNFKANSVNRPTFAKDLLGGKGFNVIRPFLYDNFINYKIHTLFGGPIGISLESIVSDNKINNEATYIKDNNRICSIIIDEISHDVYQIYEKGPTIQKSEIHDYKKNINSSVQNNDFVIFSGSLPIGIDSTFYKELIEDLQDNQNAKCILDSSGEFLKFGIESNPWLIKINDEEFLELIGKKDIKDTEEIIDNIKTYNKTKNIIVTLGENGVIAKFGEQVLKVTQPNIHAINPIASGDIFLGTLTKSISEGFGNIDSLKHACSYALTNCLYWYPNLNEEAINKFKKEISITEI